MHIRARIEGGDLGLCLFFEEILEKCVFFYTIFWPFFDKLTPKKPDGNFEFSNVDQ